MRNAQGSFTVVITLERDRVPERSTHQTGGFAVQQLYIQGGDDFRTG
jgi:hypothetical protein